MYEKALAIFCAACMLVLSGGALTATASVELYSSVIRSSFFEGGDGSAGDPFLIANYEQLSLLGDLTDYNFKLSADVILPTSWVPIGSSGGVFKGVLDGGGFTISTPGITGGERAGLFYLNSGTIKNLNMVTIDSGKISATQYAGGIAARNEGTISNSTF